MIGFFIKFRRKIIAFLFVFIALIIAAYFVSPYLIEYIKVLLEDHQLYQTEVAEGFIIRVKTAFLIAVVISAFILLFIVLKIKKSKRIVLILICSGILFVSGALFSYFILLPSAIKMLCSLLPYELHIGLASFVTFCAVMMFVIGIMFEEPLAIYVLYRVGVITPGFLKTKRKVIYIAVLIIMAVITPSQDAVTLIISMIPFIVLYEGALLWISLLDRKKKNGQH